jgi:hypothetical protein
MACDLARLDAHENGNSPAVYQTKSAYDDPLLEFRNLALKMSKEEKRALSDLLDKL